MREFSFDEKQKLLEITEKLTDEQICEHLENLAERESVIYRSQADSLDPELKELTLWRIAVLSKAADKINQDQTTQPET